MCGNTTSQLKTSLILLKTHFAERSANCWGIFLVLAENKMDFQINSRFLARELSIRIKTWLISIVVNCIFILFYLLLTSFGPHI